MSLSARLDEDVTKQKDAVASARLDLHAALTRLSIVAKDEARSRTPNLEAVTAAHNAALRAGEVVDIAVHDLATASGADA